MASQNLEKFKVKSSHVIYEVSINDNPVAFRNALNECDIILSDLFFKKTFFKKTNFKKKIVFLRSSEELKTLESAEKIISYLIKEKIGRDSIIGVVGGGGMQDIGGFISSIYMRGVSWYLFPTTYLSMVDSCIGGKTSINSSNTKNIVGNFYPPEKIFCNTLFCKTLSSSHIDQGLVEALKITYVHKKSFEKVLDKIEKNTHKNLSDICKLSLYAKKSIVEKDEFDFGERRLLNFGHTFGHSIEIATNHAIEHGFAVGLGIIIAAELSKRKITVNFSSDFKKLLQSIEKLLTKKQFSHLEKMNFEKFINSIEKDKKHNKTHYRFILPTSKFIEEVEFKKLNFNLKKELHFINYLNK